MSDERAVNDHAQITEASSPRARVGDRIGSDQDRKGSTTDRPTDLEVQGRGQVGPPVEKFENFTAIGAIVRKVVAR